MFLSLIKTKQCLSPSLRLYFRSVQRHSNYVGGLFSLKNSNWIITAYSWLQENDHNGNENWPHLERNPAAVLEQINVFLFLLCCIKLKNSLCPLIAFLFHFPPLFLACFCRSAVEQWAICVKRHFLSKVFVLTARVDNSQAFSVPLRNFLTNQRWAAPF